MTTIVDPAGSPTVILLDPSVTGATVTAAGSDASGATELTRHSNVNVVAIEADANNKGVKLPPAEEGDYFEMYSIDIDPMLSPLRYTIKAYDSDDNLVSGGFHRCAVRYVAGSWRLFVNYQGEF